MRLLAGEPGGVKLGGHADEDFPLAASFDVACIQLVRSFGKLEAVLEEPQLVEALEACQDARPSDPVALGT